MATISTNDIKIRYDIDLSQLQAATNAFDKITAEERELLAQLGKLKDKFTETGKTGKESTEKMIPPVKAAAGSIAELEAKVRKLNSEVKNADRASADFTGKVKALKTAQDELKRANDSVSGSLKNVKEGTKDAGDNLSKMQMLAGKAGVALGGIFAVTQILEFGKAVFNTTAKFEQLQKSIDFASGSSQKGAENFQFIKDLTARLGLDLLSAAEGYKNFAASSNLAGVSINETNRQFEAVSKAVAALGLSSEDAKGVFLALGQIISKGTVASEELRGQIGERLPGAFNIAAKAMGVTTAELGKMLQKGDVASKDFLPKFATELENAFGASANANLSTITASQNRFNSSIDNLILAIGNRLQPFLKGAYDLAAGIANEIARAAGEGGKKQMTENQIKLTAEKRVETELSRELFKLDQARAVKITAYNMDEIRKKVAIQKFLEIETKISTQQDKLANARIAAAGTMSSRLQMNLKKQEQELAILKAMEERYGAIAAVIINTPTPPPPIDEKAAKAAKEFEESQYQRKLKLLQIERQLATIQNQIRFGNKIDLIREEYKAEDKFQKDVYNLQVEYSKKGVQAATDSIETTAATRKLNKVETIRDLKKETEETLNEIKKQKEANAKFDQERGKAQEDRTAKREKTNKDIEKLEEDHQKTMNELDEKFAKEREERRKKELKEREDNILAATQLGQTLFEGYTQLHNASIDRQLSALEKRYSKEIEYAQGNQQKIDQLTQEKAQKEKELKTKAWKAERDAAVARVVFETASIVAKWFSNPVTTPLAVLTLANQAAQIGFIMAQRVPEFAEGTKGKPFDGGAAIVGERGVEKVVTKSGKVYFTPNKASLVDLPKGSEVVPHHQLTKQELFLSGHYANKSSSGSPVVGKLDELGSILKGLPLTQVSMDERGFEKFIRTPRRTTKILNNRFRSNHD